jgi:hypothetical protein
MIAVRPAEGEGDYRAIFALLMHQWQEVGRASLNPTKAGQYIYRVMTQGAVYVVERNGEIVASVGLSLIDFWYSEQKFWTEEWLFIAPDHRDGSVLRAIFSELKTLGEQTGAPVNVTIFNAKRAKGASEIHRIAERFFFMPGGVSAILNRATGNQDGSVWRDHDDDQEQHAERPAS